MTKTAKDENFPVGKLIRKPLRPLVQAYYQAARLADDVADNPSLSQEQKLAALDEIEAAFYGQNEAEQWAVVSNLGRLFKTENLDAKLYTDLLIAFRRDAKNEQPQIWEQLVDYCNYSAVPVGRFMLAIHNENPSTYLPAAFLCTALQLVNHLQDLKMDAITLHRFYLPAQMLRDVGAVNYDVFLPSLTPSLRQVVGQIIANIRGQLQDAKPLLRLVKDFRLRFELGVIFSLTNSMLKRIDKGNVLSQRPALNAFDWAVSLFKGLVAAVLKS